MTRTARQNDRMGIQQMKAAARILWILLAAFTVSGCATTQDTPLRRLVPLAEPEPYRLAILPPVIDDCLQPDNLQPEYPWYRRLLDGRGAVMASADAPKDIAMMLCVTLGSSYGNFCRGVCTASTPEEAVSRGADHLLISRIHDYRTILRGGNARYVWVVLLGPLVPQYWIRCLTLEARLDWEVEIVDARTGRREFYRRYAQSYFLTVRHARQKYFQPKMLDFLRFQATPEFIGELFMLDLRDRSADGRTSLGAGK